MPTGSIFPSCLVHSGVPCVIGVQNWTVAVVSNSAVVRNQTVVWNWVWSCAVDELSCADWVIQLIR